jgi:hypothetical protein
MENT